MSRGGHFNDVRDNHKLCDINNCTCQCVDGLGMLKVKQFSREIRLFLKLILVCFEAKKCLGARPEVININKSGISC